MEVIKYCKKEHNVYEGCNTIQLGTFSYFRKHYKGEEDLISDVKEGRGRVLYKSNYIDNIDLVPESYIFSTCINTVDEDDVKRDFSDSYDSFYVIKNIHGFANYVQNILLNSFQISDVIESYRNEMKDFSVYELKMLDFYVFIDEVVYKEDKSEKIDNDGQLIKFTYFTKDKKYSKQNEFRIVFSLYHPNFGFILVDHKPKILDLRLHTKYISNSKSSSIFRNNIIIGAGR